MCLYAYCLYICTLLKYSKQQITLFTTLKCNIIINTEIIFAIYSIVNELIIQNKLIYKIFCAFFCLFFFNEHKQHGLNAHL